MLDTCTISLIKFITHIWINFDTITHYERKDQFRKMINLLQGILTLLDNKQLFKKELNSEQDRIIASLQSSGRKLIRRISNTIDIYYAFERPINRQSICVTCEVPV